MGGYGEAVKSDSLWWGNLQERDKLEDLNIDKSILKLILKKNILKICG